MIIMATPSEQLWDDFVKENNIEGKTFQTRWFGEQTNPTQVTELANLILSGKKRSTAKPLAYYSAEQEAVPQVGDYFVLLNGDMKPVAVAETVVSELIPFLRISAEHAYNEGEGDLSLEDWRDRTRTKFNDLMAKYDHHFSEDDPVVSEAIKVVYRKD